MKFTYRWGQRPLEGYTLKRGLGQGGFGEVYFAVSDGGKEVALKLICGHTDTEVRGVANCLNLKHPNLVHLYDLRKDSQGDFWLVMEYIHGEPLSGLLNRNPNGLPETQAREWFLQIAHAVAYLHDHAVVHRDIKPANVFIENGIAKLGDYGLSKSVSSSQHAQSCNVGTIHYMAPEISSGTYSKQIDIYACGVMLFEMLTGQVPFRGESWAEIAMKHQTDLPDLSRVPIIYAPILEKALDKKAARRFNDMSELIQAVEAIGKKPTAPVDYFSPTQIVQPPPLAIPVSPANTAVIPQAQPVVSPVEPSPKMVESKPTSVPGRWTELLTSLALAPFPVPLAVGVWAMFTGSYTWSALAPLFLLTVAISWGVIIPARLWNRGGKGPSTSMMLFVAVLIGIGMYWLEGWPLPQLASEGQPLPEGHKSYFGGSLYVAAEVPRVLGCYLLYFVLALGVGQWWMNAYRKRPERFSLYPLFAAGIWGMILYYGMRSYNPPPSYAIVALAAAAGVIQLVSPWSAPEPKPRRPKRLADLQA